jgi:DNA-binding NarL/FixJ family response regulator
MTLRILLADDHKMMRDGLRTLIESEGDMQVIGEADNGRAAVERTVELRPHAVVMDVGMPDLNGIEATYQIAQQAPATKVVALSMHADRHFVAGMLRAGASAYLLKDSAFDELAVAIGTVMSDRTYISPEIGSVVAEDYVSRLEAADGSAFSILSPREREVLQLLVEGRACKEAAPVLGVSTKTVQNHRENIMNKLGIHSMSGLTKYAIREGLTSTDG